MGRGEVWGGGRFGEAWRFGIAGREADASAAPAARWRGGVLLRAPPRSCHHQRACALPLTLRAACRRTPSRAALAEAQLSPGYAGYTACR